MKKLHQCPKCSVIAKGEDELHNHMVEDHQPQRPCWECEVREAEPNERYCLTCEKKLDFIADFYEQFRD